MKQIKEKNKVLDRIRYYDVGNDSIISNRSKGSGGS